MYSERRGFRIAEVAPRHAGAAYQYVPDLVFRHRGACLIRDAQLGIGHRAAEADEFQRVARIGGIEFDPRPHSEFVPVDPNPAIIAAGLRKRHGQRGFRQAINRKHGLVPEACVGEGAHELVAQRHRDGLGSVVYLPDRG